MSVINTNITSLVAQQNLNKSQSSLTTAMQRLSSGSRINSAKDDAAGQAIANRMTSQITGLSQAQRNANDGISIAQTAEGALNQINDNLQRVRELTVQAQNGTNSASDIDSIQQEVNQRLEEINRIAQQTDFNGTKILSSTTDRTINIQVGSNDGEQIGITITGNSGWNKYSSTGTAASSLASINGVARTVDAKGFDVRAASTAATTTTTDQSATLAAGQTTAAVASAGGTYATAALVSYTDTAGKTAYALVDKDASPTGTARSVTFDSSGNVTVGTALTGTDQSAAEASTTALTDGSSSVIYSYGATATAATGPLVDLDNALKAIDTQRSALGAIQNRFDSAITNLSTTTTNLSAARSRIQDADYSVEVANMTKAQILQQAGTSVLAQANQIPQSVLSLLQ